MFHTIFYIPLYNGLIFLTSTLGGSIGLGVIALTLLVKFILAPLSHKSIVSQIEQKKLQPLVEELKKKYPDQKEQSKKMMELYKEHKTNPFSGCLLILIQLPIILALYKVFLAGAVINGGELYSFVQAPEFLKTMFLGIDMTAKSIILAVLAGASQFLQIYWSPAMRQDPNAPKPAKDDMQGNITNNMQKSMKYTMPIMIAVFAYYVPGAVALYWVVSNIFMIIQEKIVARKYQTAL